MRRIDEMSNNIENKLCDYLKENQFSMQIDESTLRNSEFNSMFGLFRIERCKKIYYFPS